jgi:hypothetical protein
VTPKLVSWNAFNGPGMFCMEHREFAWECPPSDRISSNDGLQALLDGLIREKGFRILGFHMYEGQYGPVLLDRMTADDFVEVDTEQLPQIVDGMVTRAAQAFPGFAYENGEPEVVRQKMMSLVSLLPTGDAAYWRYSVPFVKSNPRDGKLQDPTLFDFFHFLIGVNRSGCHTLCLFYD